LAADAVTWRQLGGAAVVGFLLLAGGNGLVVLAESPRFAVPSGWPRSSSRSTR
jgi:hypothetical protein